MKKISFVVCLLLQVSIVSTQPAIEWYKRFNYNASSMDIGKNLAIKDNNIYLISSTQTDVYNHTSDILIVKYNSLGHLLWYYKYNGPANNFDEPIDIKCDTEGNVIAAGNSEGINTGLDLVLIKFNPNGTRQWVSRFTGNGNVTDRFSSMCIDSQNNIIITGYSGSKLITIKYSSLGNIIWSSIFNTFDGFGTNVKCDPSGNIYVSGSCKRVPNDYDFILLKYSFNGNVQWVKYEDSGVYDFSPFLALDNAENILISQGIDSGGTSFMKTIKYNPDGNLIWRSKILFENGFSPQITCFEVDQSNCPIGVFYMGGPIGSNNLYINKLNNDGSRQWKAEYTAVGKDMLLFNDNIYITGWDLIPGITSKAMLLKYNSNGILDWNKRFSDDMYAIGIALDIDAYNNIYITGNAAVNTSNDVLLIKYSNLVGNINITSQIPSQFSLSQNYPNPFNPATKIKFQIPLLRGVDAEGGRGVFVQLSIHDILGREVAVLVNEQLAPGTYEIDWDASAFQSGIYFYTFTSGAFSETRKMVLLK